MKANWSIFLYNFVCRETIVVSYYIIVICTLQVQFSTLEPVEREWYNVNQQVTHINNYKENWISALEMLQNKNLIPIGLYRFVEYFCNP